MAFWVALVDLCLMVGTIVAAASGVAAPVLVLASGLAMIACPVVVVVSEVRRFRSRPVPPPYVPGSAS